MPGVFLGGFAGGLLARRINPKQMREVFAAGLFLLGAWQVISAWAY
jgi:uncharacterized membrane protein YfcA